MKITHSEIVQGRRNPRTRRTEGLNGGVITFTTTGTANINSFFSIVVDGKQRFYKAAEISTIDKETVEVAAVETGYWAEKLSCNDEFDVRSILGLEVSLITDQDLIKNIIRASAFT